MLESQLMNYGALGLFTVYLIYQQQTIFKKLIESMDRNTIAIQKQTELMNINCWGKKKNGK